MNQPNPVKVAWGILRVLAQTSPPRPTGGGSFDHEMLRPVLASLDGGGLPAVAEADHDLRDYLAKMATADPNTLSRGEALAYWLNLYNAGAVRLAIEAFREGATSVLRVPGAFTDPLVDIAGERLSLDAIEHGKLRRFKDPRIHGALVCGSLSCPTLRAEPYDGGRIYAQLDDQMRAFMAAGGAVPTGEQAVALSRVFLWFGSDFARPHRMPTFIPASKRRTLEAVRGWLPDRLRNTARVEYQDYDWGLGCAVR